MRLLGAIRLSRDTDETTSPERQREQIESYAKAHGHDVVYIAEDLDVSGAVAPKDREDLGPWLTTDKAALWNAIAVAKLDRLSRSLLDFAEFVKWCNENGKTIISVSEGIDFSTPIGKMLGNILIMFAEFERDRIRERRQEASTTIRAAGRWNGGRIPFGYQPKKIAGGYRLVRDDVSAATIRRMADWFTSGVSLSEIAARLNEEAVPTALNRQRGQAGGLWRDNSVRKILTSPAIVGQTTQMINGVMTVLRDASGQPVMFTDEPILTPADAAAIQNALRGNARPRGTSISRHLLYNVAFCRNCTDTEAIRNRVVDGKIVMATAKPVKLYGHRPAAHPKHSYYTCKICGYSIQMERLENRVEGVIGRKYGDQVLQERVLIPGDDNSAEIARLERKAESRRTDLADDPDDEDLARSLHKLEAQIAALKAQPHQPDTYEWHDDPSGITVAEKWDSLDIAGRGRFLRQYGVEVFTDREVFEMRTGWEALDDPQPHKLFAALVQD